MMKTRQPGKVNFKSGFQSLLCVLAFVCTGIADTVSAGVVQNTVENHLQREKKAGRVANALISQSSPYLLQHAYNPVKWHAWGEEAFAKAHEQNKPVFLSIGYSTCHWCHVMAHESFENQKIADYLNKYFISIKVDREERPDIDNIYMSATQLINGSGGWPMTVFLDTRLRPFYAATYLPAFSDERVTGLYQVLEIINQHWREQPEKLDAIATEVTARIRFLAEETGSKETISPSIHKDLMKQAFIDFDGDTGGFGVAPKFPKPGIFSYLIQRSKIKDDAGEQAEQMIKLTLDSMAAGGIYDQIGGGFHRYAIDAQWLIPHFEKMLYNQALMVLNYADFYAVKPEPRYREVVFETLAFTEREMRSPEGGYYSALDAGSEKEAEPGKRFEGAYYLWQESELKTLLNAQEYALIHALYDIRTQGNIYSDPRNEFGTSNIMYIAEVFHGEDLSRKQHELLNSAKLKLNKARLLRPRPHLDDKIITAWNGMMIKALANTAAVFADVSGDVSDDISVGNNKHYINQAVSTAAFILDKLYDEKEQRLYRQYRAGEAGVDATLNDYVWLINGLIALYDVSKEPRWLESAVHLSGRQDALFLDSASGAYYESSGSDTNLLFRSKSIYDGALPAANAIAAINLTLLSTRVSDKTRQKRYREQAANTLQAFAEVINDNPLSAAMALTIYPEH